jgi:'Cold-shock' DNA-binding domain
VPGSAVPALVAFAHRKLRVRSTIKRRKETMATGIVKWFSSEKGFGFIMPDDQSKDLSYITARSPGPTATGR